MLYNLTINFGEYGSKPLFIATALTYDQCDAQIQKVRQYQKEIAGESSDQKKLKITMTPVSFTVPEKEWENCGASGSRSAKLKDN